MPIVGDLFLQAILFIYNTIGVHSLGVAIIEISVITRLVFYPFIKQQTQYSKKMAELQPHLSALKEKHKGNQQAFATAQMDLFKQHGVNPAAGCLPAVVQIVVLFGLLGAMNHILTMKLNTNFGLWNMAKPDAYALGKLLPSLANSIPYLKNVEIPGILVLVAAATQFVQTKMMMPNTKKLPAVSSQQLAKKTDKNKGEQKKDGDFMSEFADAQSSMVWMFPLIFLFLGTKWPSGLALYWSVSSLIAIVQQYHISGLGGLEQYVLKLRQTNANK